MNEEAQEGPDFLAGWVDGTRAGRNQELQRLRHELAHFGYGLAADGRVIASIDATRMLRCMTMEASEGVLHATDEEAYRVGFGRGREAAREALRRELRPHLLERNLWLDREGALSPLETVEELVAWYRREAPTERDASQQSTHRDAEPATDARSFLPEIPERLGWAESRPVGALTMIVRKMKRRGAIVAMAGVVTTAVAVGAASFGVPSAQPVRVLASQSSSVAPWASIGGEDRNFYEALEAWVGHHEAIGDRARIAADCHALMSLPLQGQASLALTKTRVVEFLAITRRHVYIPCLAPLFDRADTATEDLRWLALILVKRASTDGDTVMIHPSVRASLEGFAAHMPGATADQRLYIKRLLAGQ